MRCLFIYNPVSGKGKIVKKLEKIVNALQTKYEIVDVYATKARGDMTRVVREAAKKYDAIVFSGGDGTFNEVVQGVGDADRVPELGYIPGGTVNDIAHSLHIPKRLGGALNVILNGENALLDCMKINDKYAMYIVAAGAFTSASYTTPQKQKKMIGRIAYGVESIKKNLKFQVFSIEAENGSEFVRTESVFVMLMNSHYVAGMHLNKGSSMADGKVEMAILRQRKKPNVFQRVRAFFALIRLFLHGYKVREKQITRLEGSHFVIRTDDSVVWNFDGEKGITGNVSIDVLPRKINVLVPKGSKNI